MSEPQEQEDIVTALRKEAESSRGTEGDYYGEQYATDDSLLDEAADEIERLRLTDAERKAIKTAVGGLGMWVAQNGLTDDESLRLAVVTLRGLLERLS